MTCAGHRLLRVGDVAAEIAVAEIDVDVDGELGVLGADGGRPLRQAHLGDLAERHGAAVGDRDQHLGRDRLRIAAEVARIADADGVALAALDRGGHRLGAERHGDHVLHVADHQPIAGELRAVRIDVEVVAADHPLGVGAGRARHGAEDRLDLARELLDLGEVGAEHLDADRRADAGRQHVDARLDRHGPGIGDAGKLQRLVHLGDQLVDRHAGPPFALRLQVDDGLEHLGRRRIGRGRGAARPCPRPTRPRETT